MKAFFARYRGALPYLLIVAVFVWGLAQQSNAREEDARIERSAALQFCNDSNVRTTLIREFILSLTEPPNPAQYAFIADPVLRASALEQATRSRAALRSRAIETFRNRDCAKEFPAPPDGN